MLKVSKGGVSVIAVLDRRRAKKSGVFPVKIEVVYSRIQKYYPTGVDLPASEWKRISYSKRMLDCHTEIIATFGFFPICAVASISGICCFLSIGI